jgi:hypothetical protein
MYNSVFLGINEDQSNALELLHPTRPDLLGFQVWIFELELDSQVP